jgi:hypothetical protein
LAEGAGTAPRREKRKRKKKQEKQNICLLMFAFFHLDINKKAVTKQRTIRFCFTETQSRHKQHNAPSAKTNTLFFFEPLFFDPFF